MIKQALKLASRQKQNRLLIEVSPNLVGTIEILIESTCLIYSLDESSGRRLDGKWTREIVNYLTGIYDTINRRNHI